MGQLSASFLGFCLFACLVFGDRASVCRPGCPRTHFVNQAGLGAHRDLPASGGVCYHRPAIKSVFASACYLTKDELKF